VAQEQIWVLYKQCCSFPNEVRGKEVLIPFIVIPPPTRDLPDHEYDVKKDRQKDTNIDK